MNIWHLSFWSWDMSLSSFIFNLHHGTIKLRIKSYVAGTRSYFNDKVREKSDIR